MASLDGIHVSHWGTKGPRVVLVHGGTQGTASAGHRNFRAQEALGAAGWQLLVPDRPGHGESPDPGRPDDAKADGAWVAELVGDGAHLLGHSFGGLVALAATAQRPEAIKSLILIEPALLQIAIRAAPVRKMALGMVAAMLLPYSNTTRALKFMKILGIPDEFAQTKQDLSTVGASLKKAKFPSKAEMEGYLAAVRNAGIPFLIISGSASAGFQATGAIAAEKGGGRHVIAPSEHHFPQWAGATFNQILTDFWTQAEARAVSH